MTAMAKPYLKKYGQEKKEGDESAGNGQGKNGRRWISSSGNWNKQLYRGQLTSYCICNANMKMTGSNR